MNRRCVLTVRGRAQEFVLRLHTRLDGDPFGISILYTYVFDFVVADELLSSQHSLSFALDPEYTEKRAAYHRCLASWIGIRFVSHC